MSLGYDHAICAKSEVAPYEDRKAEKVVLAWLLIALIGMCALFMAWRHRPLEWGSAHYALIARNYAGHGVLKVKGLPIQNNDPVGPDPDVYTHWPPLFPILLSFVYRAVGDSEPVTRFTMLTLILACGAMVWLIVSSVTGRVAALLSMLSFWCMPVTFTFGFMSTVELSALFFALTALWFFLKSQRGQSQWTHVAGLLSMAAAVGCSWEVFFLPFGLIAVSLWHRDGRAVRLGLAYLATTLLTATSVIGWYVIAQPALRADLWSMVLYRLSLGHRLVSDIPLHGLINNSQYQDKAPGVLSWCLVVSDYALRLIGSIPLLAMAGLAIWLWRSGRHAEDRGTSFALGGLVLMWMGWTLVMSHHSFIHAFVMLLGAPAAALAVGIGISSLLGHFRDMNAPAHACAWMLGIVVLPLLFVMPLMMEAKTQLRSNFAVTPDIALGKAIAASTPASAIVLVPGPSLATVYYAHRHIIRGIADDRTAEQVGPRIEAMFPSREQYIACNEADALNFPLMLARYPVIVHSQGIIILRIR